MRAKLLKVSLGILAALAVSATNSRAGSANFDLNTAPSGEFTLTGSAEWIQTGGVSDSGHIKLTDATGQACAVLFPDFEPGFVVAAFSFECMIKCGDWYANPPADGFSVNFAAADDPIVPLIDGGTDPGRGGRADGWAGSFDMGGNEDNLPEEGTKTGIAIGFDTWGTGTAPVGGSNGGGDVRGISVRVAGKLVTQVAMPGVIFPDGEAHDFVNDATTLITGPFTGGPNPDNLNYGHPDFGPPAQGTKLNWVPLKVVVAQNGVLNVFWKGVNIVPNLSTPYGPQAGRIVFGASTGGAMEYAGIDDIKITTDKSLLAVVGPVNVLPKADGFTVSITDSGASVVDPDPVKSGLVVKYDGNAVTPTSITKAGTIQTITYQLAAGSPPLASGSTHTVDVAAKDSQVPPNGPNDVTKSQTFAVFTYNTVGAGLAVAGVDKTKGGFLVRPAQSYHGYNNRIDHNERILAGDAGRNIADLSQTGPDGNPIGADGYYVEPGVINYDGNPAGPGGNGSFTPDNAMPGEPSLIIPAAFSGESSGNNAMEFLTFIEFSAAGFYSMGVNSDDGFRTSITRNPKDRFQIDSAKLGEFDTAGGRGASDTIFSFFVEAAGIYPFRTVFGNNTGGVNVEWFSVAEDGTEHLLNDTANDPLSWPTYRQGPLTNRAYIKSLRPGVRSASAAPGAAAIVSGVVVGKPGDKLIIEIADADTHVVDGSVKLQVNGKDVTANSTIAKAAGVTTVTWAPPGGLALMTDYDCVLSYNEDSNPVTTRSQSWNTRIVDEVMPSDLPDNSFVIEAEDFDFDNGKNETAADDPAYAGGAYQDHAAVWGVDYNNNGNPADCGTPYRNNGGAGGDLETVGKSVNMDAQLGLRWSVTRPGGREMTANFKIGWAGSPDWGNYTRTIPAGTYTAYAAHSHDSHDFGALHGRLGLVTAGVGTANQTVKEFGTVDARGSGGWGRNDLPAMASQVGKRAYFKLPGGKVTLRYFIDSGDFDWLALAPATGVGPQVAAASPAGGSLVFRNHSINVDVQDFDTAAASIKLSIDGLEVAATVSPKVGDLTHVSYTPNPILTPGAHIYTVTITDSAGKTDSANVGFTVYDFDATGAFLIEAEDFNYEGGKTNPKKGTTGQDVDVMPYYGGAYAGLDALPDVDYANNDGNDSQSYRQPLTARAGKNVNMNENLGGRLGAERGAWLVTANHKIGWVGDTDWGNYTRTFPAGNYNVYAALSFDGTSADQLHGTLQKVTSDPTVAGQTVDQLGVFSAPGTGAVGGWGANDIVPLKVGDSLAVVPLGGKQTVRFTMASGDYDYLMFVPSGAVPVPLKITKIQVLADKRITIEWEGGGELQAAASPLGPWQKVSGASSPYIFTPNPALPALYGRIFRP